VGNYKIILIYVTLCVETSFFLKVPILGTLTLLALGFTSPAIVVSLQLCVCILCTAMSVCVCMVRLLLFVSVCVVSLNENAAANSCPHCWLHAGNRLITAATRFPRCSRLNSLKVLSQKRESWVYVKLAVSVCC